ncbi:MAG: hypothetical protein ABJ327_16430 [Litoreibacter sp.]
MFSWPHLDVLGFHAGPVLFGGWLIFVLCMFLIFPRMGPRFLRRPGKSTYLKPALGCLVGGGAFFAALTAMLAVLNGLPVFAVHLTATPVLLSVGMAGALGVQMHSDRPEYMTMADAEPVARVPLAELRPRRSRFHSRRQRHEQQRLVAAE